METGRAREISHRLASAPALGLGLWALLLATAPAGAAAVYWSADEADVIQRADLDGENVETLVENVAGANGLAIDFDGDKLYWTDDQNRIRRANLDGSKVEELVEIDVTAVPVGIALDPRTRKMYWTEFITDRVRRADYDGGNIETLVRNAESAAGLALDLDAGKMYWTSFAFGQIFRANLDGSDVEEWMTSEFPGLLALDAGERKLYWTDFTKIGEVLRVDLEGGEPEVLFDEALNPLGIALDPLRGKVYWGESLGRRIRRANLDGSEVELVLSLGLVDMPVGLVIDPREEDDDDGEPTPALSGAGAAVLLALLLTASAVALRRRRPA